MTTGSNAVFANANAGSENAIVSGYTLTGTGATNYTLSQPTGLSATIAQAQLTITGESVNGKTYDGTTSATLNNTSAALSGVVNGEGSTVISLVTTGSNAVFASANAGLENAIVSGYDLTGSGAMNYSLSQPTNLTAIIIPAPLSVVAKSATGFAGQPDPVFTYTASGYVGGDNAGNSITGALSRTDLGVENVGVYTIIQGTLAASNYTISYTPANFTIISNAPVPPPSPPLTPTPSSSNSAADSGANVNLGPAIMDVAVVSNVIPTVVTGGQINGVNSGNTQLVTATFNIQTPVISAATAGNVSIVFNGDNSIGADNASESGNMIILFRGNLNASFPNSNLVAPSNISYIDYDKTKLDGYVKLDISDLYRDNISHYVNDDFTVKLTLPDVTKKKALDFKLNLTVLDLYSFAKAHFNKNNNLNVALDKSSFINSLVMNQ